MYLHWFLEFFFEFLRSVSTSHCFIHLLIDYIFGTKSICGNVGVGGGSRFKFNNLGPVLGRALIFCSRVRRIETMPRKNKLAGEGGFSTYPFPECAWSCFSNWVFDVPKLLCSWTYHQCALNSLIIIFYNGAAASNLIMWAIYIYMFMFLVKYTVKRKSQTVPNFHFPT